jgi:hypothetical protein
LTALTTLGLSGTPFHEPFHGGAADYQEVLIGVIVDRGLVSRGVLADLPPAASRA